MDVFNKHWEKFPPELRFVAEMTKAQPDLSLDFRQIEDQKVLRLLKRHKLAGFLHKQRKDISSFLSPQFNHQIQKLHIKSLKKNLQYVGEMCLLSQKLTEQNIPHLYLKGPVLSQVLYQDPYKKSSIDLDIFVSIHKMEEVHHLLLSLGYLMTYPEFQLTDKQQKINYKISHHYNFRNPEKKVQIELHWKLVNPQVLLPLDFEALYKKAMEVKINQYKIKTLCWEDYLLYLAVHGSKHRWYSLGWLKDFSMLLEMASEEGFNKTLNRAVQLGLNKPFVQSCILAHLFFDTPVNDSIKCLYRSEKGIDTFIIQALEAINSPLSEIKSNKGARLSYQLQLRKNIRYKLTVLFRLRTHHTDWQILPLPDSLFFLYYLLRPFLFLYRMFTSKKS